MTTQKPISKRKDVIPTAWHVPNPDYLGYITIDAETVYTDVFKTAKEAQEAVNELAVTMDYDSIETVEGEGCYPERVRIMDERYKKSGRDAEDHPMHGLFTGLAQEYGEISNDSSE
jgi:hypothetical protein